MKKLISIVLAMAMLLLCSACGLAEKEPEVLNKTFTKGSESETEDGFSSLCLVFSSDGYVRAIFFVNGKSVAVIAGEYELKNDKMTFSFDENDENDEEFDFKIFGDTITLSNNFLAPEFCGKYTYDSDSTYLAERIPYTGKSLTGDYSYDDATTMSFKENGIAYFYRTDCDEKGYYYTSAIYEEYSYEISGGKLTLTKPNGDLNEFEIELYDDALILFDTEESYGMVCSRRTGNLIDKEVLLGKYLTAAHNFDRENGWYTDGIATDASVEDFEYLGDDTIDGSQCARWHCIIDNPYIGDWSIWTQLEAPYKVYDGYSADDASLICENGVVTLDDSPINEDDFSDGPDQGGY